MLEIVNKPPPIRMKRIFLVVIAAIGISKGIFVNAQSPANVTITGVLKSFTYPGPVPNHPVWLLPDSNSISTGGYFATLSTLTDSLGRFSFNAPNPANAAMPLYEIVVPDCQLNNVRTTVTGINNTAFAVIGICTAPTSAQLITISGLVVPTGPYRNVGNLPISITPDSVSVLTGNLFVSINTFTDNSGFFSVQVPYLSGQSLQDYLITTTCTGAPINTRVQSTGAAISQVNIPFNCGFLVGTGSIQGKVVFDTQQPVPKFMVTAWQLGSANSWSVTDSNGSYLFPNLPTGQYILQAVALTPDSAGNLPFPTYSYSETDWQNAYIYQIDSGSILFSNFKLISQPVLLGSNRLSGNLTADSTINSNARLAYQMPFDPKTARIVLYSVSLGKDIAYSSVDSAGNWSFANLPGGQFKLRVEYPKVASPYLNITLPGAGYVQLKVSGGAIVAQTRAPIQPERLSVYPNPALNGKTAITGLTFKPTKITLVNPLGQSFTADYAADNGKVEINLQNIPAGVYHLLATGLNGQNSQAVVVVK